MNASNRLELPDRPLNAFPLWTLLRYRLTSVKNSLNGVRRESRLKVTVVSVAAVLFIGGLFWTFMDFLRFVSEHSFKLFNSLLHFGFSFFFLVVMIMLVFSNVLISFTNLFKSEETTHLYTIPVRRETIFLYKLVESLLYSSWAVLAVGAPLVLAIGIRTQAAWPFYPLAALMAVPFVVFPAGIGALIGLLLTAFVPRYRGRILAVAGVALFAVAAFLAYSVYTSKPITSGENVDYLMIQNTLGNLNFTRHYLAPNYWMAEGLLQVSEGKPNGLRLSAIFFCAISSSALFSVALGWFLAGSLYAGAFSASHGMGNRSRRASRGPIELLFAPFAARNPQIAALMIKDMKTFFRDPAQWAQVLIFFGILVIYNTNIQNLASYPLDQPLYRNLTSFLNLGAASMTLATICSRFVFPMISLEGQRFWILGLAPIGRSQIMWSKFYFAFGGTALISVPLSALSNWFQHSTPLVFAVQLWTSMLIAYGLSGLTVGMGALFPNFKELNPSKIVSGFGGTLTLIVSIGLVAFSVGGGGLLFHKFLVLPQVDVTAWKPVNDLIWAGPFLLFITVLNLAAGTIPMILGVRALEKVEF